MHYNCIGIVCTKSLTVSNKTNTMQMYTYCKINQSCCCSGSLLIKVCYKLCPSDQKTYNAIQKYAFMLIYKSYLILLHITFIQHVHICIMLCCASPMFSPWIVQNKMGSAGCKQYIINGQLCSKITLIPNKILYYDIKHIICL